MEFKYEATTGIELQEPETKYEESKDIELWGPESKHKKPICNDLIQLSCMFIVTGLLCAITGGIMHTHNIKKNKSFDKSLCFVNKTYVVDKCKADEINNSQGCFEAYWSVIEKHFDAAYEMPKMNSRRRAIKYDERKNAESKLDKHPIGNEDVCWYDSKDKKIYWELEDTNFYIFLLVLGCFLSGSGVCAIGYIAYKHYKKV